MFSFRPVLKSLALLIFLVLSSSIVAQQEDDEISTLMTNYNAIRDEGQGFYLIKSSSLYETPGSVPTSSVALQWWCDLEFSSNATTNKYGYVGRAVAYYLDSSLEDKVAQGAQIVLSFEDKVAQGSVSAVMVPTLGIFEVQSHSPYDDFVFRYWDDGSSTLPILGWEGHDEGDTHPKSNTSAFSGSGTLTKITTEAAAELLGADVANMTPATCSMEYEAAWKASHVPDPIDASVTKLEESVAQLQTDNKELMSRIVAIEGSLTANGSGSSVDGDGGDATSTSSSPSAHSTISNTYF